MKIRKIAEYTENGTQEKFEIIWAKKEEGWELTGKEMKTLRELLNSALGTAPIFYIPKINIGEDFIDDVEEFPEEPVISKSMGAGLEPEVVCENGACTLVLPEEEEVTESPPEVTESPENLTKPEEKEQEKPKKEHKQKPQLDRDYTPYITMLVNGEKPASIRKKMMKDFGITEGTANTYYYAKVRPEAEIIKAENEEKAKVETVEEKKPEPGKFFTDEERLRIQKKLGLK